MLIFYFAGRRNYIIIVSLLVGVIAVAMFSSRFHTYFFDIIDSLTGKRDLYKMGAGRFGMWTYTINKFAEYPLGVKLLGIGLGTGSGSERIGFSIARGHNDFLSLLYTTGIIGLFLYLILLFRIAFDIIRSCLDKQLKYLFLGFICAVFFMNMASNSYLTRIELAQYFYFFIGCFYYLNSNSRIRNK
jgi:O-antigen ligase